MSISKILAHQLGKPTGIVGKFAASLWNRRNAALNDTVLDLLALHPTDRVLDIGFGGGYLLHRMAASVTNGFLAGVDISPAIVAEGNKRYQRAIRSGQLKLKCAAVESLPYPEAHFNKVCSVNSIFYWQNLRQGLREIRRILIPDGLLFLCFTDKGSIEHKSFASDIQLYAVSQVEAMLTEIGFHAITTSSHADPHRQYHCVRAQKS